MSSGSEKMCRVVSANESPKALPQKTGGNCWTETETQSAIAAGRLGIAIQQNQNSGNGHTRTTTQVKVVPATRRLREQPAAIHKVPSVERSELCIEGGKTMSAASSNLTRAATRFRLTEAERDRLERLFQPVVKYLARIAAARLRSLSITEGKDIAQETFIAFAHRAVRGGLECLKNQRITDIADHELDQYVAPCRAYMVAIVEQKCAELWRNAKAHPSEILDDSINIAMAKDGDPTMELSRREQANCVQRAAANLPDHFRKVLMMHYYEECSDEEIAVALGIPLGTVKSRLHNLQEYMRALLPSDMVEDVA